MEQAANALATAYTTFKPRRRPSQIQNHVDLDGAAVLMVESGGTARGLDGLPAWMRKNLDEFTEESKRKPN